MIHHEWFDTYTSTEKVEQIEVDSTIISENNWNEFLDKYGVSGKLTNENTTDDGNLIREYSRAGKQYRIELSADYAIAEIQVTSLNLAGKVVGFHRIRGFAGPWQYIIYAVLLDIVGVSLIIFAVTGAFLWLKMLKNDLIAWVIFIGGFLYVMSIMLYLMLV